MKFFTTTIAILITIFTLNTAVAQNNMKAPVRFKLKNGVTLIVAPNQGMGKVYAKLTVENDAVLLPNDATVLINNLLAKKATDFNKTAHPINNEIAPVSLQFAEANTASRTNEFEEALTFAVNSMFNPDFSTDIVEKDNSLEDVKTYYKNTIKTSDTYLTIAGDISIADAKMLVNKIFGNWKEVAKL